MNPCPDSIEMAYLESKNENNVMFLILHLFLNSKVHKQLKYLAKDSNGLLPDYKTLEKDYLSQFTDLGEGKILIL